MPYPEKIRLNLGLKLSNGTPPMGGAIPTTRLVYRFDGVDDYISIPQVDLVTNDTVSLKFTNTVTTHAGSSLLARSGYKRTVWFDAGAIFLSSTVSSGTLDGVPIISGTTLYPTDGLEHTLVLTINNASTLDYIGCEERAVNFFAGTVYDVDIKAASGDRFYAINDGWANNPNIRDTVGVQDGTANNFNAERWEEINV